MKNLMTMAVLAILLAFFCLAPASAAMLPTDIFPVDFRDNVWAAANGQNSYTVGNTTASAGSGQVLVTADLYQDMVDGLGVERNCIFNACVPGDEEDEIDDKEMLTISLANPMMLNGFWATNFFPYPDGNGSNPEQGKYSINGLGWVTFSATESDGNNYIAFGPTMVQNIRFQVSPVPGGSLSDLIHGSRDNEYSVAGLTGVPEPGTYALMGAGLIGLAAIRRRRA